MTTANHYGKVLLREQLKVGFLLEVPLYDAAPPRDVLFLDDKKQNGFPLCGLTRNPDVSRLQLLFWK